MIKAIQQEITLQTKRRDVVLEDQETVSMFFETKWKCECACILLNKCYIKTKMSKLNLLSISFIVSKLI